MIKQKFDIFIASKYMFNNISIYKIAAELSRYNFGLCYYPKK